MKTHLERAKRDTKEQGELKATQMVFITGLLYVITVIVEIQYLKQIAIESSRTNTIKFIPDWLRYTELFFINVSELRDGDLQKLLYLEKGYLVLLLLLSVLATAYLLGALQSYREKKNVKIAEATLAKSIATLQDNSEQEIVETVSENDIPSIGELFIPTRKSTQHRE